MLSSSLTFMKIDGIDGEEPYDTTMKLIRISGFKHGLHVPTMATRPSLGTTSTLRRTYCDHGDFTVYKGLDVSSGKIFDACQRAAIIANLAVYMCRSDNSSGALSSGDFMPLPFLSIVMTNVVISGFTYEMQLGWPTERVDIRYTSISWILDWVSPKDGTAANLPGVGWNGSTNKPTPPYAASSAIPATVGYKAPTTW